MATEAQKLIGLSLTKIAQSRMNRGGISLHKNLLVATVLQKARFIFMEEAYAASYAHNQHTQHHAPPEQRLRPEQSDDELDGKRGAKRRCDSGDDGGAAAKRCCGELPDPAPRLAPPASRDRGDDDDDDDDAADSDCEEPMEVDRITSLVSVFSFGANSTLEPLSRLGRSVSTPDFCSAQAKELESIQQRSALAMMV